MVWDVTSGYSHMRYGNLSAEVMWGLSSKTLYFQLQAFFCRQICPEKRRAYVKWNAVCFLCFPWIYIIYRVLKHLVVSSGAGFFLVGWVFFLFREARKKVIKMKTTYFATSSPFFRIKKFSFHEISHPYASICVLNSLL